MWIVCELLMFRWPVSELPMFAVSFLLQTATNLGYCIFRKLPAANLAVAVKRVFDCHSVRKNLIFTLGYCRNGPKSVLGIETWIRMEKDLFYWIRILERAMKVQGAILASDSIWNPSYSKIRRSWEPNFTSINAIHQVLYIWNGLFLNEKKGFACPCTWSLISTTISCHCPYNCSLIFFV
jgi:hypothetical protein